MTVASLEARGYRNLEGEVALSLDQYLTIFHGANGSGKTNLLDAIHFGLTGTSIRAGTLKNVIGFDTDAARVEVGFRDSNDTLHKTLASVDRAGGRRNLVDGAAPSGATTVPRVSLFHPDRLQIIKGAPAHRRSMLDQVAGSLVRSQSDLRARYGKTLAQRNAQIRRVKAGEIPASELEVWDRRLASDAAPLVVARANASEALSPHFVVAGEALGLESPEVSYKPRTTDDAAEIERRLGELRSDDLGRAYVMYGPHLDDLAVKSAGRSMKQFGSQGQQRATVLALLLAERAALVEAGRPSPLLLLDDVMSELDPHRRELLISAAVAGGQVVLTTTEITQVPLDGISATSASCRVESGRVAENSRTSPLSQAA